MCRYSTTASGPQTGVLTDCHVATLGHYASTGAGLVIIEATGVQPNGRISPNCPGLWSDDQIPAVRRVSDFIKSQGATNSIQLAHAGRKGSTTAPWVTQFVPGAKSSLRATEDVGGWPDNVVGPMGGDAWSWDGKSNADEAGRYYAPRALTEADIKQLVQDWASAARRAITADKYGGSFESRIRIVVETIEAVRAAIPDSTPLYLRISARDWMETTELAQKHGSWDVKSSIKLANLLQNLGVDLVNVSSGGIHPQQAVTLFTAKRPPNLNRTLFVGAVGLITKAEQAGDIVEPGSVQRKANLRADEVPKEARAAILVKEPHNGGDPLADAILIARQFMREPEWVLKVASELGVEITYPIQYRYIRFPLKAKV